MVRVIDVSVAIKWFVLEKGRDTALDVLSEVLRAPSQFAVPEVFYFELVHVFSRAIPEPDEIRLGLLSQVATLGIQRFSMTPALLAEIHILQKLGLSGYDAAYVGLAKLLGGRWITFDSAAHGRIRHLSLSEAL